MTVDNNLVVMPGVGVAIGRFQTPYLHKGHLALLERINQHEKGIVFIGCAPTPVTKKNPMDFMTRKSMIQAAVGPNVVILPIHDNPSDHVWSNNLDRMIREVSPFGKVVLYHSRDSFKDYYHGHFTTVDIESLGDVNATNIRDSVGAIPRASEDFRAGVIYASQNMYPRVQPTVDVIVYNGKHLLLGRKPKSDKYCFVGGFIDMTDPTAQVAGVRELQEETGLITTPDKLQYVGSYKINDWRDTPSTSVMTTCFKVDLKDCQNPEQAKAADDLEQVEWFNYVDGNTAFADMKNHILQKAHHVLFDAFCQQK